MSASDKTLPPPVLLAFGEPGFAYVNTLPSYTDDELSLQAQLHQNNGNRQHLQLAHPKREMARRGIEYKVLK
jgi:hypothetical protein